MSTSAADYYRVGYLTESQEEAKGDLADAEYDLARAQEALARCQENVRNRKDALATADGLVSGAQARLDKAGERCNYDDVIEPRTGLKQGRKVGVPSGDNQMEYAVALSNARQLMAEGRVEEAMGAELIATALLKTCEHRVPHQLHFFQVNECDDTVQVPMAGFVDPKAIPEREEDLVETLSYAEELYEDGTLNDPKRIIPMVGADIMFGGDPRGSLLGTMFESILGKNRSNVPKGVNPRILMDVIRQIRSMEQCHKQLVGSGMDQDEGARIIEGEGEAGEEAVEGAVGGVEVGLLINNPLGDNDEGGDREEEGDDNDDGGHDDDDDNGNDDDDDGDNSEQSEHTFTMSLPCWLAVEKAIRNQISIRKESNAKELELPHESSSKIARYNPKSHFQFASEEANAEVDDVFDALLKCKLRSRPTGYNEENPSHERLPFEFRTFDNSGFDLDGDLIAMCGDEYHDNIRESKNFVGFQKVPCPVNLDSCQILCELRDSDDSNEPWDTNTITQVWKDKKRSTDWFGNCIADAENSLIWAANSRSGTVHAFPTDPKKPAVAKLSFPSLEAKAQRRFVNGSFALAKCEGTIIGSGGTGNLSSWKVSTALENDGDEAIDPKTMIVDHSKNFCCGDLQYVGNSQTLVAPLRISYDVDPKSGTIRLYDINSEAVVGLFCGTQGEVSIGNQYCWDSHSVMLAMSSDVGAVFDVRTFQPTIALHVEKAEGEQILGVPTNSSAPVAFTYGSQEEIKCWDLRMPASHAYTMSTGNTIVNHLFWHEDTSSLIASTRSDHIISHGRYGAGYMYGESLGNDYDEAQEKMYENGFWPRRAGHDRSYFGYEWHCDCQYSYTLLQYPFLNGRGMHERPARLKRG